MIEQIRNIAIIAHVDHGKTTLVDKLLQQTGTLNERAPKVERLMDSNALEKERGITILAKNTCVHWRDHQINIVDTPGHADFGGEVERILSMVDSVLLLVDAVDGPMPQTRFVTQKAFARGLNPIVVINKIDRPGARPHWVMDQVFDLFDNLGATDAQLDFPVVYASALNGYAKLDLDEEASDMNALLQTIIDKVAPPDVDADGPFQMQISSLDYSSYVGTIGIGRITRGQIKAKSPVKIIDKDGNIRSGRLLQLLGFKGLDRVEVEQARAGDIIAVTGIEQLNISDTLCDPNHVEALPALTVDEPTISMTFQINDSPFAGQEGKFVTSRKVRERLQTELLHNVALRVEDTEDPDKFRVSGRGELHLSILIENMRREGFELAICKPEVILREENGEQQEPYERLTVDVEENHQGSIMEKLGERRGELQNMVPDGKGRVRLDYLIPTRGLIGFHTEFLSSTSGTGLMYHVYDHYGPAIRGRIGKRINGVLIANCQGTARAFALFNLQDRGRLFIEPQAVCYEGMIVGIHARDNDLVVNVTKEKQLTNIRASGSDENIILTPAIKLTLEQALEFIDDDELVEVTPQSIRLRKKALKEHERKRASRASSED
ncbi:TPA: translational GTPase TypA [Legionella feeleii]|uniref:Large ribosomal subunit assembly factor BipA n=1 Tax=Legionella feeleii TaxID=453 RepID=A0A0W0U3Z8_9GAMM|nr:translational GTPase TypA [Legionella feeleii]KTD02315.1 virulence regulator BipA [Legionella feeleii]SPX61551.1 GTP-binding protein TypA [Legionella feeleii]STX37052.1 GTP-binding protein TypA [Legionella feeleii]